MGSEHLRISDGCSGREPSANRARPSSGAAAGEVSRGSGRGRPPSNGWFMESNDARFGAYWDHEPGFRKSLEIKETIVRFMERKLQSNL
jgi:hypothetical protein